LVGLISAEGDVTIRVDAAQTTNSVTRYLTGACIEDVNHEIYGGIFSQMVFGESFQEDAPAITPQGFFADGGKWFVEDGALTAGATSGPRLVFDCEPFADGGLGAEILFPDRSAGLGGIIARAKNAGLGMDDFFGYEISLDASRNVLVFGKHRKNWEHIRDTPFDVPVNEWISVEAKMAGKRLEVIVNGKSVFTYDEEGSLIESGSIALRPFSRSCKYRNVWIAPNGEKADIPLVAKPTEGFGDVSSMWRCVSKGSASGKYALVSGKPFIGVQSQRIEFTDGEGVFGIENQGLNRWGMCFREGKPYEGRIWVRADSAAEVWVSAENMDGSSVYAEAELEVPGGGEWIPLDFALTPSKSDNAGRFAVALRKPGAIDVGYAFLQPGEWGRFKGLPIRKDVAEALIAQKLTVLRYGGSMINAAEYRWKKMIGPRDKRPQYKGTWYAHSTNGWGIVDFLDLCEACGFLAVPVFNMGETPDDMVDFIEYVNGPATSLWGSKRAEAGHPEPYNLKHLELGNEEKVNEEYWNKFRPLAEAIWSKDPSMIVVVGDLTYGKEIKDPYNFDGNPFASSLEPHRKIMELAKANGKPVWFDVHIGNDEPHQPDLVGTRSFIETLGKICPGADYKVVVFEENSGNHAIRRGLGHANAIMQIERLGAKAPILCAANCLQPDKQNDNGWDQGMLFLNPSQVWGQPPYYVTQIIAGNYLPNCVKADALSGGGKVLVTATSNADKSALVLQVLNIWRFDNLREC
jgi:hypothetical protein